MRIGILSCYDHHNYGSMLQAYATQKIMEESGHEAITIAYLRPIKYMTQSKARYYFHKITNKDILTAKIRLVLSRQAEKKYPEVVSGRKVRAAYFEDFYRTHCNLSKLKVTREELSAFSETCDAIVVGSDQLWNPISVEHDFFTLTFVPDYIKKISYATSIGTTKIPGYQIETYKKFLKRFDSISVREKSGAEIILKLGIDKPATVVLDPTLLFTRQEWMSIQDEEPIIHEKYILCYFLGINEEHRKFADAIKRITGYRIVALQHLDEFVKKDLEFGDIRPYDVGPSEFINLIRNAEYVCTDSFHGACFSILNHKNFFSLNRYADTNTQSTNTRIDSLLSMTGLEGRRVDLEFDMLSIREKLRLEIDYDLVDARLEKERKRSRAFLKDALER